MAKIEIDNVKMWEFFRRALEEGRDTAKGNKYLELDSYIKIFDDALKNQGLEYKDSHIISILEQTAIRIEKGNWYACSCEIVNDNKTIAFPIDEIYYCPKDGYIDVNGMLFEVGSLYRYFRPATEEEINKHLFVKEEMEHIKGYREKALKMLDKIEKECEEEMAKEQYFKVGDRVRLKGTNVKGDVITNIYESGGVTMYEFANSDDAPQSERWELVEPKQENIPTFKELERNGKDELSEFEQMLVSLILRTEKTILTPDGLAKEFAPKLMNLARKQIASEIDVDAMVGDFFEENTMYTSFYRKGAADMLNKIKEG